jgi:hypothetical protein
MSRGSPVYLEHIYSLDRTLEHLERAGCKIGPKSQFCMDGIKIVGFVYGAEGRSPDSAKITKILEWRPCENIAEATFIGVCVYYRTRVPKFAIIATPIHMLSGKMSCGFGDLNRTQR